jgi:protein-S-isoprenylcysteine O-methyltransferase Ste14
MDWSLVIAAAALVVTVVVATINYAALDDTKRERFGVLWKKILNVGVVILAVGISILTVLAFWLSDKPISRSSIVVLGMHFFNLGIWLALWFLSFLARNMSDARSERKALRERLTALELQLLSQKKAT